MKKVVLFHNPGAGDGEHSSDSLMSTIRKEGYECHHQAVVDDEWDDELLQQADIFAVAGGDGSVRAIVKHLCENDHLLQTPIAVLPMGTSNNIARSLDIHHEMEIRISSWRTAIRLPFNISSVRYGKKYDWMIEGVGAGLFPDHIKYMIKHPTTDSTAEERQRSGLLELIKNMEKQEPYECELELDGRPHSGKYLMVEIMNNRYVGPTLELAPDAVTNDGLLNVVLIAEKDRDRLRNYLRTRLDDGGERVYFTSIRVKKIRLKCESACYHLDDELLEIASKSLIDVGSGAKRAIFLV